MVGAVRSAAARLPAQANAKLGNLMLRPDDHRPLDSEDFRRERSYLADHCFAIVSPGRDSRDDLVGEEAWESLMHLPTDVLLRTSESPGTMVTDMHDQWSAWIKAMPDEAAKAPFMFGAALDAADEFGAGPFIAMHGWYRPATAALRNAVEGLTVAAGFATREDTNALAEWRAGKRDAKFGNAMDFLQADPRLTAIDARLGGRGVFRRKPSGIVEEVYERLCLYAHSRPGYTNVDSWNSNGPVFVPKAFTQFWEDFCDTVALSYILLAVGSSGLALPEDARPLFGFADERWHGLGGAIESEFFPD
jgi:hypothetical protein